MLADGTGRERILEADAIAVAWQPSAPGASVPPVQPSPTPSLDPGSDDLGLGFSVCNVTSVNGRFTGPDAAGTAFVATRMGDTGGCPDATEAFNVVAVDLSGDGLADLSYGPIECELAQCVAFAAPDVDGDGTDELLVQNVAFSVTGLILFDLVQDEGGPALVLATVEPPGDAAMSSQGFDGSAPPQFWLGGDAFTLDSLRCDGSGEGRLLVSVTAEQVPPDSPDSVWEVHETVFELDAGILRVIETRDFTEPTGGGSPDWAEADGCGADLRVP
jgi:hypothetical protein